MLAFSAPLPGLAYRTRPGAYALALRPGPLLLVVETAEGLELPGGGIEAGETPKAALRRELREETGYLPLRLEPWLSLLQYWSRPEQDKLWQKRCSFYRAELREPAGEPSEEGHRPLWVAPEAALGRMAEECQEWIIRLALGLAS